MASSEKNYHVFVSFRGTDVRNTFLRDLYAALDQKGIYTFVDSEELRKGEQISPALMRAIGGSRVAIIIFSEDYASSRWCLEELAKIMECKARKELIVWPVFYKVEPRGVRRGMKVHGRAMAKHDSDSEKDLKTVETWNKVLFDAGSLSGWVCNDGDEAEVIQSIVKELPLHLERTPLHVAEYLVGIDSQVKKLISLSQKESDGDDVLMIGLWGPGGIGKTTIAKAIYNAIETQFQGAIFLDRVRETSNKCNGLVKLQNRLLSQTSRRHLTVYSEGEGSSLIRKKLCHKKVLLVLDDVDHLDQLNALVGQGNWFGKGSRIFVTSRDRHLLTSSHCKNCVYEVETLKNDEARDLFVWHAFPNGKKVEIREDLIDRALHYGSGLPLALEVLGSFLRGRNEPAWESALRKLSNSPDKYIDRVLKISFDGLEENEREIFLDFACFFKGKSIEYIKNVLDGCGFETTIGIEILIDRSLIRNEHGTLQMHDLVQLMGQNIVNQECTNDPRKRSRLWLLEDVQDILCEDTGVNAVKAIVLDLPALKRGRTMIPEERTISPYAFRNMKMLRMLILKEVHSSSQDPIYLPNNLRWLEWSNAPFLEFGSVQKKLVGLDIQKSHIRQVDGKFKNFECLKYINFRQCKSLVSVPDLSSIPNLESLNLDGCESLVEVHQSVACHDKLKFLSLQFCFNLTNFPHTLKAKSLQALDLVGCSKLEKFSDIPGKMEHLEELDLGWTAIKELPTSIENLVSVKIIKLRKCKKLTTLPSSVYKLQNLEHLDLGCSNFVTFPENSEDSTNPNGNPGFRNLHRLHLDGCNLLEVEFLESSSCFPNLGHLDLSRSKFTHLPTGINKYHDLEHLWVNKCKQLQKIPQLPPNVHILRARGCRSLQEFPDLSSLSSNYLDVDVSSCRELFRKGASTAHVLSRKELLKMTKADILLTGTEMPEWFLPCKDGSISFMVPRDSYDKFVGLALCLVLGPEEGEVGCGIEILVNGQRVFCLAKGIYFLKSDLVWVTYLQRSELYHMCEEREVLREDWNHFQVHVTADKGRLKKVGFRLICEQQEDELRIELQHHRPTKKGLWRKVTRTKTIG
ncbi:TMV resistance protein N-like [Eucalyptus grandis]|uniref:TMV resistance protein N-like n=1 Tax=Eucalyptus grandis TaxID=71139 RepID=UPI00192E79AB|nr:TMV resistance protein N-like [Eucalyptus grandis]